MWKNTSSQKPTKNIWEDIQEILFGNDKKWSLPRMLIYGLLCLSVCYLGLIKEEESKDKIITSPLSELMKYDTYIPKDYNLVTISIANSDALDSIFGNQGVVDLYIKKNVNRPGLKLIARNLKLLRAPKNPKVFAVLCPKSETRLILDQQGIFYVSIVNPNNHGTKFVTPKQESSVEIDYL